MVAVLYEDTFRKHPFTFLEALRAQGIPLPTGQPSDTALQEHYDALLDSLATARSYTNACSVRRDLLRDAFISAQTHFSAYDCRPVRSEDSLTGSLCTRLSVAVQSIDENNRRKAESSYPPLGLWSLELISAGREQRLGGDIAFVLEGDRGLSAVCLQAKRADPKVDHLGSARKSIRQAKHTFDKASGSYVKSDPYWQLNRLRSLSECKSTRVSAAYVFYNNGDLGTGSPILPLVLPTSNLPPDIEETGFVDLGRGTVDLASHIASLVASDAGIVPDEPEHLYNLARALAEHHFTDIIAVGSTESFVQRLARAFESDYRDCVVTPGRLARRPRGERFLPRWPDHEPVHGQAPGP